MKKAFTLAEVLITLGIIGVVAALTIPSLLQKYSEKKTVSMLRESQSMIAQAMRAAEAEHGEYEGWFPLAHDNDIARPRIIAQNLTPFLKLNADCSNTSETKVNCLIDARYLQKNAQPRANYVQSTSYYAISLLNGSSLWWSCTEGNLYQIFFYIDTNGKNPPNTWGKDLFMFIYTNGSLYPAGHPNLPYYKYETDCKAKNSTGIGCAYHVLTQQNMNYLH